MQSTPSTPSTATDTKPAGPILTRAQIEAIMRVFDKAFEEYHQAQEARAAADEGNDESKVA